MADVDGGSLSFQSQLDNDQLNQAIEETLRRVQGLSDGFVGAGDMMDKTTQEIVQSIETQRAVIKDLETTVSELDAKIDSIEPGDAQNILIQQANAARKELDAERQGLATLETQLRNLQQANTQTAMSNQQIRQTLGEIGAACESAESDIARLETEYQRLGKQMSDAFKAGRDEEYRSLQAQQQAIKGEITVRKKLLSELREQSNVLEAHATKLEQNRAETESVVQAHVSLRSRIKELREEMARLRMEGIDENSEAYKRLVSELGRLQDIQGDIQTQGSIMSNDQNQFAGMMSGLQGIIGGFTAASSAISLFAGENEELQAAMLKTQQLMSILMGLQQVSQTLNKDSAFSLVTLTGLRQWWNNLLAVGRGEQVAETASVAANTIAEGANTAAIEANTAAETRNAAAKAASKGAIAGSTAATGANTVAQGANTVAATAGTAANIGLAGAFRMVGAAIKSIPVFGWIAAAIGVLIGVISHFVSKASEAKKAAQEFYKGIAENAYQPIGKIEELSVKWNALGDDLEAKEKFVRANADAFNQLGVSVKDVADAENILVANKDKFIDAQIEKAKAAMYLKNAEADLKKYIEKEQEWLNTPDTVLKGFLVGEAANGALLYEYRNVHNEAKDELHREMMELKAQITQDYTDAANAEQAGWQMMEQAGINATAEYADGTLGAIEHAIQLKQQALKNLTNNDEYKAALEEIAELQKQADAITGTTRSSYKVGGSGSGGSGSSKDPFLEKLQKRKAEYQRFLKWVNSGDSVLAQAANQEFASLLAEGKTYLDYLMKQRDQLLNIDVSSRTKAQNQQLRTLNNQIAEETKKTVLESFNEELNEQLANAKTVIEMLNIIEQRRRELANDGTELDDGKKNALDEAERNAREQAKSEVAALLEEYSGYVQKKQKLEEEFQRDMALLAKARLEATSEADIAAIDAAIANRRRRYAADNESSGDEDYDKLKGEYKNYQQEIAEIQKDFAEKRRIAQEHNDTELLNRLAYEETQALSEIQKKMLESSDDWRQLFGNLDDLSTSTIRSLIERINAQKLQFSAEFSPEDLQAINEQLEKARQEIESRNPFAALGSAYSRLREQIRANKLLDSNDAFVQELQDIEKQYKQYQAWITSGNQTLADGANENFAELLQKGGTYLEFLKRKKAELQGKIDMGVDVGNSMEVIDAMIERVESGKSSADLMREALKDSFSSLGSSLEFVKGAFDSVVSGMEKMGVQMDEETQQILGDIGGILDGAQNVAQGIATGNPLSIIQGSISLISSAFDLFNTRDRKAEKSIKKHKKNIEELQNAYNQLSWAIDKALGGEVYKNQQAAIKNMKKQQQELYGMINDENSKKHTDSSKIREYREQIAELDRQIQDMLDSIAEDILQTDAKSFADSLGDSLVEAFASGEDAAKAFETTVNEVLRNAVVNQLKKKFLENQLQSALDDLYNSMGYWSGDNFIFDGLTDAEIASFRARVQAAADNYNNALALYSDLFKDMFGDTESEDSMTGAVKGVTEETANILAGQMNAIRINQIEAAQILRQQLQTLNLIANNTSYCYLLQNILTELKALKSQETDSARSQGLI